MGEGMRFGVDRNKYQIHIPLPPKIDPTVTMMQVEEKPDVTYSDVGGCKEQIEKLREVVETPLLHPERFVNLGIEPPGWSVSSSRWPGPRRLASSSLTRLMQLEELGLMMVLEVTMRFKEPCWS